MAGKIFKVIASPQQAVASKMCEVLISMLQLSHPNIVQCEGVALLPDQSPLPVLLMERLKTSLHAYLLDPVNSNLPVERKLSFLLDTAQGLDYLHSHTPAIIHRDLTATNVLLDSQLRAKITDVGNSQLMEYDSGSNVNDYYYQAPYPTCPQRPREVLVIVVQYMALVWICFHLDICHSSLLLKHR